MTRRRLAPGEPRMMVCHVEVPREGLDMDTLDALLPAIQAFVDGWLARHRATAVSTRED